MKKNPTLSKKRYKWFVGVDEVGRGPLAGPVSVGLFAIRADSKFDQNLKHFGVKIGDSKKISESDRVKTRDFLVRVKKDMKDFSTDFHFSVLHKSAAEIDKRGITVCIHALVNESIKKFSKKYELDSARDVFAFLDGSLKTTQCDFEVIIKGDSKVPLIGAASIIAKVTRDELMKKLAQKHPKYGLEIHKGYGTLAHRTALKKHGPSLIHRTSFLGRIL